MKNFVSDYRIRRKQYLAKHKKTEIASEYIRAIVIMLIMAFISSLTYKVFLAPPNEVTGALPLISGGASGLARSVGLIFHMTIDKTDANQYLIYSVAYAILNLPVIYLAFRRIGFRFAILTVVEVGMTSVFTAIIDFPFITPLARSVACVIVYDNVTLQAGLLTRTILAGVFAGITSALALSFGGSAGGTDTVSYYFSMRKSNNVGKYIIVINSIVFFIFVILNAVSEKFDGGFTNSEIIANAIVILLFELIYSFVTSLVIDSIAQTNRKEQIQIITKVENLSKLLLTHIPHGATIVRSKGAFTGEDRIIIYVIVSTYETKEVIKLVRDADPNSFINVTSVKQVYGRFARPKIK